jgi:hypothetical protein
MTKDEAIAYIRDRAGREGLTQEVLHYFYDACDQPRFDGNYRRAANEALYDWDC